MLDLIGRASAAAQSSFSFPSLISLPPTTDFKTIVARVLSWILMLGGIIAVIYLIYGGILYITAGGDAEKATKGRVAVVNAIIGIIIIALAFVIVQFVLNAVTKVAS